MTGVELVTKAFEAAFTTSKSSLLSGFQSVTELDIYHEHLMSMIRIVIVAFKSHRSL